MLLTDTGNRKFISPCLIFLRNVGHGFYLGSQGTQSLILSKQSKGAGFSWAAEITKQTCVGAWGILEYMLYLVGVFPKPALL